MKLERRSAYFLWQRHQTFYGDEILVHLFLLFRIKVFNRITALIVCLISLIHELFSDLIYLGSWLAQRG